MKNLKNLKGAKALNKEEQQSINGGMLRPVPSTGPCGGTGGMVVADWHCQVNHGCTQWYQGKCYACY